MDIFAICADCSLMAYRKKGYRPATDFMNDLGGGHGEQSTIDHRRSQDVLGGY
jgi:hypothetical protein